MEINLKSGDIYFTRINIGAIEGLSLYVIHKQTGKETKISVPGLGQSTAIDNANGDVYLATDSGVYKLLENGTAELYTASVKDVMYLTALDGGSTLYAATYPDREVYKITQDGKRLQEIPDVEDGRSLTVDHRGTLFYTYYYTPYVLKAGDQVPMKIEGLPRDKIVDFYLIYNEVFAMGVDSHLYHLEGDGSHATDWGSFGLTGVYTFALDKDNDMHIGANGFIKKFDHYATNPCSKE